MVKRCFVNDTPTKASALQDITGHLVDINSQKDEGLIHRPLEQLSLIDSFVEFRDEKKNYEEKFIEYKRVTLAIKELENIGPSEDLDYLKFVFEELNKSSITQEQYISLKKVFFGLNLFGMSKFRTRKQAVFSVVKMDCSTSYIHWNLL